MREFEVTMKVKIKAIDGDLARVLVANAMEGAMQTFLSRRNASYDIAGVLDVERDQDPNIDYTSANMRAGGF